MTYGDPTLHTKVVIDGTEEVNEQLAGVQKKGEEAAAKVDDAFQKSSQSLLQLSEKAGRFGSIWTHNVTMPIIALGTAAVAMSADVLKGEESVAKLTDAWKGLKSDVATAIVPTINALITDTLIPLVDTLGDLVTKWGEQSEAAKNSQLAILGLVAIVGPVTTAAANIGKAIGLLKLAFIALKTEAAAAWLAVAGPVGIVVGAAALTYYGVSEIAKATGIDEGTNRYRSPEHTDYGDLIQRGGPYFDIGAVEERERDAIWAMMKDKERRDALAALGGGGGGTVPKEEIKEVFNIWNNAITDALIVRMWNNLYDAAGNLRAEGGVFGADIPFNQPEGISPFAGVAPSSWSMPRLGSAGLYGGLNLSGAAAAKRGAGKPGTKGYKADGGDSWYDALMSNDFLMNAGAQVAGTLAGGGKFGLAEALPLIGSAFGAPGAAIGALLGGLFQKKQRGDTPQNPVHVKVINPGDLATALSNAVKSLIAQVGAVGMDDLVEQVRKQGQLKGYS